MNIAQANTEPFFTFLRTREELDRTIKVTTGALRDLQVRASREDAVDVNVVQRAVAESGEPWGGGINLQAPGEQIDRTINHLSGLWTSAFISAFHLFLDGVAAEQNRWASVTKKKAPFSKKTNKDGDIDLELLYQSNGWSRNGVDALLPVFRFFEVIRNCVVHRSGLASDLLVEKSQDKYVLDSIAAMSRKQRKVVRPIPELPSFSRSEVMPILPRHAILAGEICYRLAVDINQHLVSYLGQGGMTYMAAFYSIIADEHPARRDHHVEAIRAICLYLKARYRASDIDPVACIQDLRDINKWQAVSKRFAELYGVGGRTPLGQ